jgi:muramidase (phage lysozyme)
VTRATPAQLGGVNRAALLDAIAWSELTELLKLTDDGYNVLVGCTPDNLLTFSNYAAHPDILNAEFDSTAAGRYQFIHATWLECAQALGLTDFLPFSQDLGCAWLARVAMPAADAGRLADALAAISHIWASLPGSAAGQRTNTLADLTTAYVAAGGSLA